LRPVTRGTAILADPGRRDASGRRRGAQRDSRPLDERRGLCQSGHGGECAPGVDPADVPWAREIELVSLNGQVREACLWTGELATREWAGGPAC